MEPLDNPFRPGAGRRPPVLTGRARLLDAFDIVRQRAQLYGEGDRSWILSGLRGVGKTVLLNELSSQVSEHHWIAAKVEVKPQSPLPVALATALMKALRSATGKHPTPRLQRVLAVFKAFSLKFDPATGATSLGLDITPQQGVADSGRFPDDLTDLLTELGETSRTLGIGTLLLIDELQEATPADLSALNTAIHHLGQEGVPLPVMVVGAGLPSLPALLADATSYVERLYEFHTIGLLDETDSAQALTRPTGKREVEWEPDALALALHTAGGYPYFLQSVGKHVWDAARTTTITLDDVEVGTALARREINEGLYLARWERATTAQQKLLRALAELGCGEPVSVAALATALKRQRTSDISNARIELIRKGLIYSPERGILAFTIPGMHQFIADQQGES